jgi:hypothetical protein
MSVQILHIQSPGRWDAVAAIVGDRAALQGLREAVDAALATGSGGAYVFSADGEGYALAVALEPRMYRMHTSYAGETEPVRSLRETMPLRAMPNFSMAYCKALRQCELAQKEHNNEASPIKSDGTTRRSLMPLKH